MDVRGVSRPVIPRATCHGPWKSAKSPDWLLLPARYFPLHHELSSEKAIHCLRPGVLSG